MVLAKGLENNHVLIESKSVVWKSVLSTNNLLHIYFHSFNTHNTVLYFMVINYNKFTLKLDLYMHAVLDPKFSLLIPG